MLEQAWRKLRSLIQLIESASRKVVYTSIEDAGRGGANRFALLASAVDFDRFRSKAKAFYARTTTGWRCTSAATSPDHRRPAGELEALLHEAWRHRRDPARARDRTPACRSSSAPSSAWTAKLPRRRLLAWSPAATASASQLQFIDEIVQHLDRATAPRQQSG